MREPTTDVQKCLETARVEQSLGTGGVGGGGHQPDVSSGRSAFDSIREAVPVLVP